MDEQPAHAALLTALRKHLDAEDSALNRWAVLDATRNFLAWRDGATACPDRGEARAYLDHLLAEKGETSAHRDYSFLLLAAAMIWGKHATAHLAPVLREARCTPKQDRATEWDTARQVILTLPEAWRSPFTEHLESSRTGPTSRFGDIWSACYIAAVARALSAWATYCESRGLATPPTGQGFDAYAEWLRAPEGGEVTYRTVADYLGRILAGFEVILHSGPRSTGACWVAEDFEQHSRKVGPTTKPAAGIVPASRIYALGWDLIGEARTTRFLGTDAARQYRNGLLLVIAVSLPERTRALAALDLATTFRMAEHPRIELNLPGAVLKQRERNKPRGSFRATLSSPALWDALDEYRRIYRPLFDEGTALFPSIHARNAAISEQRIGQLVGDVTERRLGVRVSVHRIRDCVATEASEELVHGGLLAPVLLRHKDARTTRRHYDHAEGLKAVEAFATYIEGRQSRRPSLLL